MNVQIRKEKCSVLVVGGGGAGLTAAITAANEITGKRVILATRGHLGKSGVTAVACSDRMAFHATLPHTEPGGDRAWKYHANDIYEIGGRVSDANLATVLAENAKEAYGYLEQIGVPFVKKNGLPHQFVTDGSDYARACYTGPKTGVHMEEKLVDAFFNTSAELFEDCGLYKILTQDNRVCGILAFTGEYPNEELILFETEAVIMATGGGGTIYHDNVFPRGNSGDGFSVAYLAGAELVNMEFIQIGIASVKTKLNCSGSMMRAIPKIINDRDEEFLVNYFPPGTSLQEIYSNLFRKGASWPVTYEHKTHLFDIAVYKENYAGRKVFLDYSTNPKEFEFTRLDESLQNTYRGEMKQDLGEEDRYISPLTRLKEINIDSVEWLAERGIDLNGGEKVEVAACIQHFQGGIKINSMGETRIKGLYAAGECAGGQHGANRPGGNALLDGQVFGRICGKQGADYASSLNCDVKLDKGTLESSLAELDKYKGTNGLDAEEVRRKLRILMTGCASVVRTFSGLEKGLAELAELQSVQVLAGGKGLAYAAETEAMLTVAEAILRSALERDESRGPHLRFRNIEDNQPLPRKDPHWQKYNVLRRSPSGEMELLRRSPISSY